MSRFKELPAYGAPLFATALLIIYKRQWPQAMNWRHSIGALTLSMAVYIGFQLMVCYCAGTWAPLELIWKENVIRFFEPFDHKGPIWTYFIRIFDLAAPWSLLLPAALIYLLPKLHTHTSNTSELIILFGGVFIFFTLSGSRRSYYLLPIIPFFAILTGRFMADFINNRLTRTFDLYIKVFGILLSIALAAPIIILFINPEILPYEMSAVGHSLWVTATAIALISPVLAMGILSQKAKVLAGAMMAVWLIYSLAAIPLFSRLPNIRSQVAHVRSLGRPIGFLPRTSDRVLFYLDQPCPVFSDQDAAFDWATRSSGVLFVTDSYKNKLPVAKMDYCRTVEKIRGRFTSITDEEIVSGYRRSSHQ